ncbi:MAG: RraA family protein [Opitutales bacterium]|nr:RraA family protein [Opitutales bacterium]
MSNERILSHSELLQLKRWNTPTLYNGWEQITNNNRTDGFTNREETTDFMPQMGPMVGYAMTVVIQPGNPEHPSANPNGWNEYREYLASVPGPKIVVAQDLDKPEIIGSFWGEVNANICRTLGCVGTITDGAVRDLDEMTNAGFKALAQRLCVGHAYSHPVRWNCEVEVFGNKVQPGQLMHADKHGFIIIPEEDQTNLLDASIFMDKNECDTLIAAAREAEGLSMEDTLDSIQQANKAFNRAAEDKFGRKGEW